MFSFTLYVRSYAPFKTFGMGFHGDNRGPTTRLSATSRLWLAVDLDPVSGTVAVLDKGTSGTKHVLSSTVSYATAGVRVTSWIAGHWLRINLHLYGSNPALQPASPNIDVHLQ